MLGVKNPPDDSNDSDHSSTMLKAMSGAAAEGTLQWPQVHLIQPHISTLPLAVSSGVKPPGPPQMRL